MEKIFVGNVVGLNRSLKQQKVPYIQGKRVKLHFENYSARVARALTIFPIDRVQFTRVNATGRRSTRNGRGIWIAGQNLERDSASRGPWHTWPAPSIASG